MKKTYVIAAIVFLLVGFASVVTNLFLNGTIKFSYNQELFDKGIVFTYAKTKKGQAFIEDDGKSISYETSVLSTLNETSTLEYEVSNKSKQYDGNAVITCGLKEEFKENSQYITINNSLNGTFQLNAGETKSGTVEVKLIKAYAGDDLSYKFTCTMNVTPIEKTEAIEFIPKTELYHEEELNGTDPVIKDELIPVYLNSDGDVFAADVTHEWYNYENQEWANAVILKDESSKPTVGSIIEEDDIESYFVWIPKYKYQLWNVGSDNPPVSVPLTIDIEFTTEDTTNTTESCVASSTYTDTSSCSNGKWMTQPAFLGDDVTGIWVAKFETGYAAATDKENAVHNEVSTDNIIIKPDSYSWRGINVKNSYENAKGYKESLNSALMKNTEWAAVAYLSHSKYGINGEIKQNTHYDYKTGYAAYNESYNTSSGYRASTTGNITGIYDMSGGAWDRVAAYHNTPTKDDYSSSGFTKEELPKLTDAFDVYSQSKWNSDHRYRILGDATGEMGAFKTNESDGVTYSSWYDDYGYFIKPDNPWFGRGGDIDDTNNYAGLFAFNDMSGGEEENITYRIVLRTKDV